MDRLMRTGIPLICAVLLLYLLAFQVGNTDFWWHIKAGQLLRESGWIHTDPFAYTRAGQPYLAVHEWLAQLVMSFVYDSAGWQGITVLRVLLVGMAFGIPLLISTKNIHLSSMLALLTAVGARPSLTDRPQLFTFVCFSAVLVLCLLYLDEDAPKRRRILTALPLILLVWSNMHGAASVIGLALIGAIFADQVSTKSSGILPLLLSGIASAIALLCTPSGIDNILYLQTLFADHSASLIAEWQPSPWSRYLLNTGPLWIAALGTTALYRRHIMFSLLVLLGIGYLSRTAARHETLLLLTALGITLMQLRFVRIAAPKWIIGIALLLIGGWAIVQAQRYTIADSTFGYGEFAPMRGAAAFLQHKQTGPIFNSYNAGGELLYHDIPVFLDGRNIDYGYDYIQRALAAGANSAVWHALEDEYNFTDAVIFYPLEMQQHPVAYIDLLQNDPEWSLTYLDDWAAVYSRTNSAVFTFSTLTPHMLYTTEMPEEISLGKLRTLQAEVKHILELRPDSIKAQRYLQEMQWAFASYLQ